MLLSPSNKTEAQRSRGVATEPGRDGFQARAGFCVLHQCVLFPHHGASPSKTSEDLLAGVLQRIYLEAREPDEAGKHDCSSLAGLCGQEAGIIGFQPLDLRTAFVTSQLLMTEPNGKSPDQTNTGLLQHLVVYAAESEIHQQQPAPSSWFLSRTEVASERARP